MGCMYIKNSESKHIVSDMIDVIQDNKDYLSQIDGAIGDGDHGINMNKGFSICKDRLENNNIHLSSALELLGTVLLDEIGGSMGPIYGTFFLSMSDACKGIERIGKSEFGDMLKAALEEIQSISNAKVGDKTLMDTLVPAIEAYETELDKNKSFIHALEKMKEASEIGKESTRNLIAKIGRASRLGERSKGTLDAGAVSCNLILCSMANSIITKIRKQTS